MSTEAAAPKASRLRELTAEYVALAAKLREGGGAARVAKLHQQGKLAPRERVAGLLDPGSPWVEIGLLMAGAHRTQGAGVPAAVPG